MFAERWYQTEAVQSVFDYFESGKTGNPIIAMPTGTGKSVVIASLLKRIYANWPNQNVIKLTHVKELIDQNANKLRQMWPSAPLGIYSAGLGSRDTANNIIFGGIQSVAKLIKRSEQDTNIPPNMRHFGFRDLMFIDECQLLSPNENTQYQYTIRELQKINPYLKVVGLTATHYRLKQGLLTDGGIFTDVCYDLTGVDSFNRLVAEGFLAPLITKRTDAFIDLAGVHVRAGEYVEKEVEQAAEQITYEACKELFAWGRDRNCWLVFGASIKHVESITAILQSMGVFATCVHSGLSNGENNKRLEDFKAGKYQCLVNKDKLTTGFDHAPIDFIGMLRATCSPGLWVQMLGRGTRPYNPEFAQYIPNFNYIKENCLVLDFARNAERLGPINDPVLPRKPGKAGGEAPIRICDACGVYNHAAARHCCNCGQEFKFSINLHETAGTAEVMKTADLPIVELLPVQKVLYNLHEKEGSPPSIKVSYFCGFQMFNEWVCLEHQGYAGQKARNWWMDRHWEEPPQTTAEALKRTTELRMPQRLRVHTNKKHPEVIGYEF